MFYNKMYAYWYYLKYYYLQNYQKDTTDTLTMVTDDEKLPINCNNVSTNTNFNISRSGRIIKRKIYNNENNEVVPKPTKFSKDNGTISNEHYKNSNIEGPSEVNGTIKGKIKYSCNRLIK